MKRRAKLKGFTLVELLIVIVVIGVLSAMMMLSSTEAVSSAKAAKVINNLRQLKTAALSWYMDNLDIVDGKGKIKKVMRQAILRDNLRIMMRLHLIIISLFHILVIPVSLS